MTTNQEFGQLGQQGMIYLSDHPVTSRCTAVRSGLGSRTIYADSAPVRCALRGRVLARALRFSVLLGGLEPWNFMTFHISGIIIPIDSYVSKGLKPPTSVCRTDKTRDYWWLLRIFYKSMQYKCMWSYIYIFNWVGMWLPTFSLGCPNYGIGPVTPHDFTDPVPQGLLKCFFPAKFGQRQATFHQSG